MLTLQDKERAKDVIVAIIEEAGGVLDNKTNLFKAFFHAHLEFARAQRGYLTTWPIVKMPHGPGIEHFDQLIGELLADDVLEIQEVPKGDHTGFRFSLRKPDGRALDLPAGFRHAVQYGVGAVKGKPARTVSRDSHQLAWESAEMGEEMNVYVDLIEVDEFSRLKEASSRIDQIFDAAWPQ